MKIEMSNKELMTILQERYPFTDHFILNFNKPTKRTATQLTSESTRIDLMQYGFTIHPIETKTEELNKD